MKFLTKKRQQNNTKNQTHLQKKIYVTYAAGLAFAWRFDNSCYVL
jgi:uncharacterized protein YwgA